MPSNDPEPFIKIPINTVKNININQESPLLVRHKRPRHLKIVDQGIFVEKDEQASTTGKNWGFSLAY